MIKVVVGSFLLLGFFVKAQEFQGKAEYFSKRIIKEWRKDSCRGITL